MHMSHIKNQISKDKSQKRNLFGYCLLSLVICSGAVAQSGLPLPSGKSSAPIEVTSDALEVLQEQNKAIFKGNVVAVQGGVRLKSDAMTVFYNPSQPKDSEQQGAISRLEAAGNVLLTTQDETASGASGVYVVDKHQVTLQGNVVLTRDKNVLKGDTLTYDLNTGKSSLIGGKSMKKQGEKGQRVRALFIPEKNDKSEAR